MPRLAYRLTAALFTLVVAAKFDVRTGFSALVRFGSERTETRLPQLNALPLATVPDSSGYDGQFYAQLALSPALTDPALTTALDAPAYRARRILVPATAHLLGFGRPAWIVQAYALLNVACWAAFAILLLREIPPTGLTAFARWFACVFSLGVLDSVRQSLVDLPALLLLLLAVRAARPPPRTLWSALGHLAKETNVLASCALAVAPGTRWRGLVWLPLSLLPLAVWLAYVAYRLPAGETGWGNFTWPFLGAIAQLSTSASELVSGNTDSRHLFAVLAIPGLFLQATVLLLHRTPAAAWWRIGVAYAVLLVFLGPWVWSGYWAACRAVLPLTIAFNLLLPTNRAFWPLLIAGNLPLLHGVWRFL